MRVVEEPARPMLLVPGVCGSILNTRPRGSEGEGERAWVSLTQPDARYQKLWGRYNSASGRVEGFEGAEEVLVPEGGDPSGLYPISILDPDITYGLPVIHYFDAFIDYLTGKQGYTIGKDLFGFGYDFRQSNVAHCARLLQRLRGMYSATGQRANIVSHSMGGLVVKSLLIDHPREFEELVASWVAIAAPFGGAPGFGTDALLTGVQFAGSIGAYFFVDRGTFRQACVQSPAVYELLPPPGFQYERPPPEIVVWLRTPLDEGATPGLARRFAVAPGTHPSGHYGEADRAARCVALADPVLSSPPTSAWHEVHEYHFSSAQLPTVLGGVLDGNTVSIEGQSRPMPYNCAVWERALESHRLWGRARLPATCKFFNLYGTGYETPYSVQYGSWWFPVNDLASLPHSNASFTYVDGDGTVPTESAKSDGLDAAARVGVQGEHRPLISLQTVWDQVLQWVREPDPGDQVPWQILVPP